VVGYSPQDVPRVVTALSKQITPIRLDYVFIDGRHETEAVKADFDAVYPFLSSDCVIFFHDIPCIQSTGLDYIANKFGSELIRPVNFHNPYGFNLGYLERC
jgi:hypothetical protein